MSNRSRQAASPRRARRSPQSQQVAARPAAALIAAGILTALVLAYVVLLFAAPGVLPPFMRWGIGPTAPAPSAEGRISFVRTVEGQVPSVYVVNPDGTNQQQLTRDIVIDQTSWSQDGRYIVAQAQFNRLGAILRIEVGPDNKPVEILNLTNGDTAESVFPAWSPDGTQIAFQSKRGGGDWQIHVMKADGSDKRMVTDGKGLARSPVWSPDGKTLAYMLSDGKSSSSEIYVVPASGGAAKAITSNGSVKSNPLWTHDGQSIAFIQGSGDRDNTIAVVSVAGGQPRGITEPGAIKGLQLSPTESRLAYYRILTESQGTDILTVSLDGGSPTVVTPDSPDDYLPAWSPDGKRLTWMSSRPENTSAGYKIVVGNIDGSGVKVITPGPGSDFQPQWASPAK
ncbi:MAG: TolB protein [Chloroflexia bacterium]|nr:TolB protein [Chloroflexia bacterium]